MPNTIKGATGLHPDDKILGSGQKEIGLNDLGEFISSIVDDQGNAITLGTILDGATINTILYLLNSPIEKAGLQANRYDKDLLSKALYVKSEIDNKIFKGMFSWSMLPDNKTPKGWIVLNGAGVNLNTEQGQALNSFDDDYKKSWDITIKNDVIYKPNLFAINEDSRGLYIRATPTTHLGTAHKQAGANQTHTHTATQPPHAHTGTPPAHTHTAWQDAHTHQASVVLPPNPVEPPASQTGFNGHNQDSYWVDGWQSMTTSQPAIHINPATSGAFTTNSQAPTITVNSSGSKFNTVANVGMIPLMYLGV